MACLMSFSRFPKQAPNMVLRFGGNGALQIVRSGVSQEEALGGCWRAQSKAILRLGVPYMRCFGEELCFLAPHRAIPLVSCGAGLRNSTGRQIERHFEYFCAINLNCWSHFWLTFGVHCWLNFGSRFGLIFGSHFEPIFGSHFGPSVVFIY